MSTGWQNCLLSQLSFDSAVSCWCVHFILLNWNIILWHGEKCVCWERENETCFFLFYIFFQLCFHILFIFSISFRFKNNVPKERERERHIRNAQNKLHHFTHTSFNSCYTICNIKDEEKLLTSSIIFMLMMHWWCTLIDIGMYWVTGDFDFRE